MITRKCNEYCENPSCSMSKCPRCLSPVSHSYTHGNPHIEYSCRSCDSVFDRFHQGIFGPFCSPELIDRLRARNDKNYARPAESPRDVRK